MLVFMSYFVELKDILHFAIDNEKSAYALFHYQAKWAHRIPTCTLLCLW